MFIEIIIAGFGGQGVMSLGKIISYVALKQGLNTTFFPSYGAEVRGGTAHSIVKISSSFIASPVVDNADIGIIMNRPSLVKFRDKIRKKGLVIINSDLCNEESLYKKTWQVISLPFNNIALTLGNLKVANVIELGVLSFLKEDLFPPHIIEEVLSDVFPNKSIKDLNIKAFHKGRRLLNNEV